MNHERLIAKVKAVNLANSLAADFHAKLTLAFTPFIGKSIFKTTNEFTKKAADAMPIMHVENGGYVYRIVSCTYALLFSVKTCENYDDHCCIYHEAQMCIGGVTNGVLNCLYPLTERCTNYNIYTVLELRAAFKRAEQALSEASAALFPFGRSDS